MSGFDFSQYEHELFWRYYDKLHTFFVYSAYCLEKWELLDTVYEGVNHDKSCCSHQNPW